MGQSAWRQGPSGYGAQGMLEAFARFAEKDIVRLAGHDARLVGLSERHVQQVGMVLHKNHAHRIVAQQERREGIGKHVPGADPIPDLAAVSSSSLRCVGALRTLQSVMHSISSSS